MTQLDPNASAPRARSNPSRHPEPSFAHTVDPNDTPEPDDRRFHKITKRTQAPYGCHANEFCAKHEQTQGRPTKAIRENCTNELPRAARTNPDC